MIAKLVTSPVQADRPLANSRIRMSGFAKPIDRLPPQRTAPVDQRVIRTVLGKASFDLLSAETAGRGMKLT